MKVFLQRILQEIIKKIILGTLDAWLTIHLSHGPSDRAWIYLRLTNFYFSIFWFPKLEFLFRTIRYFRFGFKPNVVIESWDCSCFHRLKESLPPHQWTFYSAPSIFAVFRNMVREIWFKKSSSRNLVQEIWLEKSGSANSDFFPGSGRPEKKVGL